MADKELPPAPDKPTGKGTGKRVGTPLPMSEIAQQPIDMRRPSKRRRKMKADQAIILAQDMRLWELKTQGWSDERIATEIGLGIETVRKRIIRLYSDYRVQLTGAIEAKAAEQVAQYEYIRDEALEAWRKSKKPKNRVSKTTSRKVGPDGEDLGNGEIFETTSVSQEEREGDPRFLDSAMKAMDKIAQLLRFSTGMQVDVSVTHQGPDGGPIQAQQHVIIHDLNYDEMEGDKLSGYLKQLAQASLLASEPLIALDAITPQVIEGETVQRG